jgi:hypothetical protein
MNINQIKTKSIPKTNQIRTKLEPKAKLLN